MKFKKEAKIALVVTLIILLFFWGFNFLKGRNLFSSYNYYYSTFEQVDGLQKSNSVTVNGFVIGLVSDIRFSSERLDKIQIEIGVKKEFKIPKNSTVSIVSSLLGDKSIVLQMGDSPEIAENGDILPGVAASDMMEQLMNTPVIANLNKVLVSVDSVLTILQSTFDNNTQRNIRELIANVEELVSAERVKIGMILTNFESVSGNLKKNNEDITNVIANLNSFSETLAASDVKNTVDNANRSLVQLNTLLSGINEGEGTLGKFAKDDSAYIYLQRSLNDLDRLLIDLRENPKDYVHFSLFGKKSKK